MSGGQERLRIVSEKAAAPKVDGAMDMAADGFPSR